MSSLHIFKLCRSQRVDYVTCQNAFSFHSFASYFDHYYVKIKYIFSIAEGELTAFVYKVWVRYLECSSFIVVVCTAAVM